MFAFMLSTNWLSIWFPQTMIRQQQAKPAREQFMHETELSHYIELFNGDIGGEQ
jgi:hypothetical protein